MTSTDRNPGALARPVTIAVIDDHAIVRRGLVDLLADHPDDFTVVAAVATVDELLTADPPLADLVVFDLYLEDQTSVVDRIPEVVARGSRVVLHTTQEKPVPLREAVRHGASGLILKRDDEDDVMAALRLVADGDFACSGTLAHSLLNDPALVAHLTTTEREVLELLNAGLTRRAVAKDLDIAESTVATHLKRVKQAYEEIGITPGNISATTAMARVTGHIEDTPWRRRLRRRRRH